VNNRGEVNPDNALKGSPDGSIYVIGPMSHNLHSRGFSELHIQFNPINAQICWSTLSFHNQGQSSDVEHIFHSFEYANPINFHLFLHCVEWLPTSGSFITTAHCSNVHFSVAMMEGECEKKLRQEAHVLSKGIKKFVTLQRIDVC
jgi:hypothetical protein